MAQPLTDLDLLAFTFVGDPQLSPDGRKVAFTRTTIDGKENVYRSQIHVVPTDGSAPPVPWTNGPKRDTHPRYSPDGCLLAFLSEREGDGPRGAEGAPKMGPQVYCLPVAGGEARRVTAILGGVSGFAWAPDSRRMAVEARIAPGGAASEPPPPPGEPGPPEALYAKHNSDVRHVTRLAYRIDGMGWFEDRRAEIVAPLEPIRVPAHTH